MIEVTIKEKKYKVASEWADVSLGQYLDLLNIQNDKWEDLDKSIKMVASLSDNFEEFEKDIYDMDADDFTELSKHMLWINTEFTDEVKKVKAKKEFKIDGRLFKVKENYNVLTLGEMTTVELLLKEGILNTQEIAFGILLREVVNGKEKKFDMEDFTEIVTTLKYKINLIEIFNYITFFLSGVKTSTKKRSKAFSVVKI